MSHLSMDMDYKTNTGKEVIMVCCFKLLHCQLLVKCCLKNRNCYAWPMNCIIYLKTYDSLCLLFESKARPEGHRGPVGSDPPPELAQALAEAAQLQGPRDEVMHLDSSAGNLQLYWHGMITVSSVTSADD